MKSIVILLIANLAFHSINAMEVRPVPWCMCGTFYKVRPNLKLTLGKCKYQSLIDTDKEKEVDLKQAFLDKLEYSNTPHCSNNHHQNPLPAPPSCVPSLLPPCSMPKPCPLLKPCLPKPRPCAPLVSLPKPCPLLSLPKPCPLMSYQRPCYQYVPEPSVPQPPPQCPGNCGGCSMCGGGGSYCGY